MSEKDVPILEKRKVSPPGRAKNTDLRPREHLAEHEVETLICAAKRCRHGHRDSTLILVMYSHGLRAGEAVSLKWSQIDLKQGIIHVSRLKNGTPSTHPLRGKEIRALRKLMKDYPDTEFVFVTERKGPLTVSNVQKIIARSGRDAGFEFKIHPHMLRHSTGYKLANEGQDTRAIQLYLGHKSITHTVRYTELSSARFNNFWKD